jgi:hypothetical protein
VLLPEGSYSQVCYVVRDIEEAAHRWTSTTGAGPWFVFEAAAQDKLYRGRTGTDRSLAALAALGGMSIELYQPLDDEPSIINEILDSRGEGFHHVHPRISGLSGATYDARCAEYERKGLEVAMSCTFPGIGRAAFYDALDTIGGFIEVLELGAAYPVMDVIAGAHQGWDGERPMRTLDDALAAMA